MRLGDRSSTILLAVITIILALVVGLVIPLAGGSTLGGKPEPWTPPRRRLRRVSHRPSPRSQSAGAKSASPTTTRVQPTATRSTVATPDGHRRPNKRGGHFADSHPDSKCGRGCPACPGPRRPVGLARRPEPGPAGPQLRSGGPSVYCDRSHRRQRLVASLLREQRAGVVGFAIRGVHRHPHDPACETLVPKPLLGEDHR